MSVTNPRPGGTALTVGVGALPEALAHLADEIDRSRELLSRPDDWDDAGSPGYAEATWDRAIGLLIELGTRLWIEHQVAPTGADVFPGSRGNIDVELRTLGPRLLVSIAPIPSAPIRYFGHRGDGADTLAGILQPAESRDRLVEWLAG